MFFNNIIQTSSEPSLTTSHHSKKRGNSSSSIGFSHWTGWVGGIPPRMNSPSPPLWHMAGPSSENGGTPSSLAYFMENPMKNTFQFLRNIPLKRVIWGPGDTPILGTPHISTRFVDSSPDETVAVFGVFALDGSPGPWVKKTEWTLGPRSFKLVTSIGDALAI